jgi:2-methylisocitrate lyase-like PEP mutase family enzyme
MNEIEKAKAFAALHAKGSPLVLYNIWDAGTAGAVASAGAKALATGSWSVAAAHGFGDGEKVPFPFLAEIARLIAASTDLPLSVDFEGGYAVAPDEAAANVEKILDAGAVGINFEDQVVGGSGLHPIALQAERIRAIRAMAGRRGVPFFINARTDVFLAEADTTRHAALMDEALARADAFEAAGASGFFAPGLVDPKLIGRLCEKVALPVNIMVRPTTPDNATMARLGVSRISYGPAPYRAMIEWLKGEAAAVYRGRSAEAVSLAIAMMRARKFCTTADRSLRRVVSASRAVGVSPAIGT